MKKWTTLLLPALMFTYVGAASAADDPTQRPWALKMKEKQPEWYAKMETAWKALDAARTAWKDVDGGWKKIAKDKSVKPEEKHATYTKRHETLVALRNAEIAWHQWHIDRKKFDIETYTTNFAKWKEKISAAPKK